MIDKHLEENKYRRFEIIYSKGGVNLFSGNNERRGYYLLSYEIEKDENSIKFSPFDENNFRFFLKEAKRYSKKKHDELNKWLEENKSFFIENYNKPGEIFKFIVKNFHV